MTLRDDARGVLSGWTAPDDEQDRLRQLYVAHTETYADAMSRECHPDHLTASAIIFSADHQRVLLTLHRVIKRWLQTGGHCEPDDATLAEAALREGREESGIGDLVIDPVPVLLSRHEVPCGPIRPAHHLDVQYVAVAPAGRAARHQRRVGRPGVVRRRRPARRDRRLRQGVDRCCQDTPSRNPLAFAVSG